MSHRLRTRRPDAAEPAALTTELVLAAYRHGVFPMGDEQTGEILWFSPDPRAILDLDRFHLPRTLRSVIRRGRFSVTADRRFREVILACRRPRTWITDEIVRVYTQLHALGFAHSVEVWTAGNLAGGLYGVAVGAAFFGESMFHYVTDASKVALAALVQQLRDQAFRLLDLQWLTDHLRRFGAEEIPRSEYLRRLAATRDERSFLRPGQSEILIHC